jgi:HEAT repeat protein
MSNLRAPAVLCAVLCLWAAAAPAQQRPAESPAESVADLIAQVAQDDYAGRAACDKLIAIGAPAVPELLEATRHAVPRVRYWSIAALSGIGDDRAPPAIQERLKDPDGLVRAVAVWHLGRWYDRAAVRDAALALLRDKDKFVRGWVLKLIAFKKDRDALPRVLALLQEDDEDVRYDALHTAAVLQGPDAVDLLKKAVQTDKSALVRECAARSCTVIEPPTPRTAEVLIEALGDPAEEVRQAAVTLLRKGFDQFFGFNPRGTAGDREAAAAKWREWYRANRDRLEWDPERRVFRVREQAPPKEGAPAR